MEWLQYEDGTWIGVVLALTELVKRVARVPRRWVPVVPLLVAVPIGLLVASQQPWEGWAGFLRLAVSKALTIGSLAMAFYKVARTTVFGA